MSAATTTKGELTRSVIVAPAQDLFILQGYKVTSMRKIAQKAGIALGGIYVHFVSREDIFDRAYIVVSKHSLFNMAELG